MTVTVSTRELREQLADVIDRARHDDVTLVTSRGREVAAVVPIDALRALRAYEDAEDLRLIDASMANPGPTATLAEVMAETLARKE